MVDDPSRQENGFVVTYFDITKRINLNVERRLK